MRIFGSERISGLMLKLGMEEGIPIEHGLVTRSIERAQRQVEAQNFAVRKHLLEYDDVMNKQRTAVYDMRRIILEGRNTRDYVLGLSREVLEWYLETYAALKQDPGEWNTEGLNQALKETFGIDVPVAEMSRMGRTEMAEHLQKAVETRYAEKEQAVGPELMLFHQRMIMLQIVDGQWKDHLYSLDHLKEGIGLRGYGQRDPLVEYKKESFAMFQALMDRIDEEILRWIFLYQPAVGSGPEIAGDADDGGGGAGGPAPSSAPRGRPAGSASASRVREPELAMAGVKSLPKNLSFNDPTAAPSAFARAQPKEAEGGSDEVQTIRREGKKVGRNDPCPCGSGKKYKKCHGGG
jgi:preprotein translocase subunit SecA